MLRLRRVPPSPRMFNYIVAAVALWFAFDLLVVLLFGGRPSRVSRNEIRTDPNRRGRHREGDRMTSPP